MLVQRPSESVYRVPCRCPCHSNRPNWKRCRTVAVPVPTSYCSRVRLVSDWSMRSTERQAAPWRLISRPLRPWPGCRSRPSTPKPEPTRKSRNLRPTYWCVARSIRGKKVTDRSGSECRRRRVRHLVRAGITTATNKRRKRAVDTLRRWCWPWAKVNEWRAAARWLGGNLRRRSSTHCRSDRMAEFAFLIFPIRFECVLLFKYIYKVFLWTDKKSHTYFQLRAVLQLS